MSVKALAILNLIIQVLAQAAVIAVIPPAIAPYLAALVATIHVILAFYSPAAGMAKAQANLERTGSIWGNRG